MYISSIIYDFSYDGQAYHQLAVIDLKNGWNPVYDQTKISTLEDINLIINSYPKGIWFYQAAIYKATGYLETSKFTNFALILASFLLCYSALTSLSKDQGNIRINGMFGTPLVMSIVVVANPINVYQSLSFMIDSQVYSLFVCLVSILYFYHKSNKIVFAPLILNIILLLNTKFTGVLYTSLICLAFLLFTAMKNKPLFRKAFTLISIAYTLGIFYVGYNPYVTNLIQHGNAFYPVYGSKNLNIMYGQRPKHYDAMNRFEKLANSIFSASANPVFSEESKIKLPFTIQPQELAQFSGYDLRGY